MVPPSLFFTAGTSGLVRLQLHNSCWRPHYRRRYTLRLCLSFLTNQAHEDTYKRTLPLTHAPVVWDPKWDAGARRGLQRLHFSGGKMLFDRATEIMSKRWWKAAAAAELQPAPVKKALSRRSAGLCSLAPAPQVLAHLSMCVCTSWAVCWTLCSRRWMGTQQPADCIPTFPIRLRNVPVFF